MSRSILLQLARDSIGEVLRVENLIDKNDLIKKHPLLEEKLPIKIEVYLKNELIGFSSNNGELTLIDAITIHSKKAVFQTKGYEMITLSKYLQCELEITLFTKDGEIKQRDNALFNEE